VAAQPLQARPLLPWVHFASMSETRVESTSIYSDACLTSSSSGADAQGPHGGRAGHRVGAGRQRAGHVQH